MNQSIISSIWKREKKTEYNSGLHDNFIRVNTQEKVIKR